jgi:pyroglutamyl-peptidase
LPLKGPRLLVTGFGPFPGAPTNPTELLMQALADEKPEAFGVSAFKAVVLPTEYTRSWITLQRLFKTFAPEVVVHFGMSGRAEAIHVETLGRNAVDPAKPDAVGASLRSGRVRRGGPDTLDAKLPVGAIIERLAAARIDAALSTDAGDYVCNATLYRSLLAAPPRRRVGFIHVPPAGRAFGHARLLEAARVILETVARNPATK